MNSIFNPLRDIFPKYYSTLNGISNTCANCRFIKYLISEGISGLRNPSSPFKNSYPSNHFPRPFIVYWLLGYKNIFTLFSYIRKRYCAQFIFRWWSVIKSVVFEQVVKKIMIRRGFLFTSNIIILSYFIYYSKDIQD